MGEIFSIYNTEIFDVLGWGKISLIHTALMKWNNFVLDILRKDTILE